MPKLRHWTLALSLLACLLGCNTLTELAGDYVGDAYEENMPGILQEAGIPEDDAVTLKDAGYDIVGEIKAYAERPSTSEEKEQAAEKAQEYKEKQVAEGKSETELEEELEKTVNTEAGQESPAIAVPVAENEEEGTTDVVLIDAETGEPVDDSVYTIPEQEEGAVFTMGDMNALYTG